MAGNLATLATHVRFCDGTWEEDGKLHACYLDKEHPGCCICGGCAQGFDHEEVSK